MYIWFDDEICLINSLFKKKIFLGSEKNKKIKTIL